MTKTEYFFELDPSLDTLLTEEDVFFDIETTGLSKSTTILYLIGCAFKKGDQLHLIQWFNEDAVSEEELLQSFFTFLEGFHGRLITFNGDSFDIPYLRLHHSYHMAARGLDPESIICPLDRFVSLDLYRVLKPFQHLFKMHHGKQKDWEHFIGLNREDQYDGGQLIKVYKDYLVSKDDQLLKLLLLHNMEDVRGMSQVMTLLAYEDLLHTPIDLQAVKEYEPCELTDYDCQICRKALPSSKQKLPSLNHYNSVLLECRLSHRVPVSFAIEAPLGRIVVKERTLVIVIPVYDAELKHFFKNYKDYYYLPKEDMAVHKSVGCFVSGSHRKKAKAANCYVRKDDLFFLLPRPHKHFGFIIESGDYMEHFTLYKVNHQQKHQYVTFDELFLAEDKKNDTALYLNDVIKEICISYLEGLEQ